ISCLNDDVLSEIFLWQAAIEIPSPSSLGWIRITHVSRHWRAVALHVPLLWARSVCTLPAAFAVLLQRAKSAPL
ncbi:hypothetical protein K488DRAFT_14992, partial [Vararia minispora EC-137]